METGDSPTVSLDSDLREDSDMREVGNLAKGGKDVGIDISEVYSPPRVAKVATRRKLKAGTSFDITTCDENGIPWDLLKPEIQEKCRKRIIKEKPKLLIGSVMCRDWSQIMNINWDRMEPEEIERRMKEAQIHLEFVCSLYKLQHDAGRYFAHEHPQTARSWEQDIIKETIEENEGRPAGDRPMPVRLDVDHAHGRDSSSAEADEDHDERPRHEDDFEQAMQSGKSRAKACTAGRWKEDKRSTRIS